MLKDLRQKIDDIDRQIIALLDKRTAIVEQVGHHKKESGEKGSFIRPGREATMVRDLVTKATLFPKMAIGQIWRLIICASLSVEHELSIGVFHDAGKEDVYFLAREYFGSFTPVSRYKDATSLIGDLMQGSCIVGIFPLHTITSRWWQHLDPSLQAFALLPEGRYIAVAKLQPEETGDDRTLLSVEARKSLSRSDIQAEFQDVTLHWLSACPNEHTTNHLVEISGFVRQNDPRIAMIPLKITVIGSYASPLVIL